MRGNVCRPVQVLQQISLRAVWQTEDFTQQRQQVNSLEPGVTVTWLRTERDGVLLGLVGESYRANCHRRIQNATSPAVQSWSDSWCFWWCSLRLLSDYWFSACTWNNTTSKSQHAWLWNRKRKFWELSKRKGGAYWKKLYFASMSNLSMLIWNTFSPLVLCWQKANV